MHWDKENPVLSWTSYTEINNNGFTIERSTDGTEFSEIGFIKGKKISYNEINYQFPDTNISANSYYYRIKQSDIDGKYLYSNTAFVSKKHENNGGKIYPNPFSNLLNVVAESTVEENYFYQIFDMSGRLVKSGEIDALKNQISMEEILSPGLYILTLEGSLGMRTYRIEKSPAE